MIQSSMVLHRGARLVELDELERVPCPPSTDTWFPVPHKSVLTVVSDQLTGTGFAIDSMELALSRDDARFFGVLRLKNRINDNVALTVGVRSSHDKSFPIGLCMGSTCFICDNMAFSSEVVIARRHTKFGNDRFAAATAQAVLNLHQYQISAAQRFAAMEAWQLSPQAADSLILRAFETGIVSSRLLPDVIKEWRQPRHPEFRERNAFSMLNSFTEVLKERQKSNPQEAALQTIRLQRLLEPPQGEDHGVIDVPSTPA